MPLKARVYILATWAVGGVLVLWQLSHVQARDPWVLLTVVGLSAVGQTLQVVGATDRSSYNIGLVGYAFAFVLWGAPEAMLVILVACLAEWAWHRFTWYIQTFNICALAVSLSIAETVRIGVGSGAPPTALRGLVALLAASFTFSMVNHFLVGVVILFARGESFAESGVFRKLTLIIDATMLGMGATAGIMWSFSPIASALAIVPLYLMYSTLRIPALERQAITDPKTGLYNARYFNEMLQRELERADRYDRDLTVVVGDLDLLRNINNTYGHLAGDTVLIGVAKLLEDSVREYDIVARVGGEEFAILMGETSLSEAIPHIEALRKTIESAEFEVTTSLSPIRATISFGIAEREAPGQNATDIIHAADLALYKAKLSGRNRVCLARDIPMERGIETARSAPQDLADAEGTSTAGEQPTMQAPYTGTERYTEAAEETSDARPVERRRNRTLDVVIGLTALAAIAAVALAIELPLTVDWRGLLIFAVVTLLAESLSMDLYARDSSVSTSVAPFIAGTLLFGPIGAVVLSLTASGAALLKNRSPVGRFTFNTGTHILAGLACLLAANSLGTPYPELDLVAQLGITTLAAGIVYAITTVSISFVIHLTSGQSLGRVWGERFRWLWPYYGALALVAFAFVFGYQTSGVIGVAVVLIPLMTLRFSQAQYLERTKRIVSQLRATNTELERRQREVTLLSEDLLVVLSDVVDLRDPFVLGHSQQVAVYARLIADEMGLPAERLELIRDAGLLHDVGKLGIPEAILSKAARLTVEEYQVVQKHAPLGAEIIGHSRSLQRLVPLVRHHHERYDGTGYPDRLAGKTIPLEARILAVADAVEAMASDRPYRIGLTPSQVLDELLRCAGSQFDPAVVDAFCEIVEREGAELILNSANVVRMEALNGEHRRLEHLRNELEALALEASDLPAS